MYFRSPVTQEDRTKTEKSIVNREDGPILYQADTDINIEEDNTTDIIDKIKAINNGLRKPSVKQLNFNKPMNKNSQGLDRETLEKIKQIVALAKRIPNNIDLLDSSYSSNPYSRDLKFSPNMIMPSSIMPVISYPYIMNIPVLPMISNELFDGSHDLEMNNIKSVNPNNAFQTRQQQPSFPGFTSFPQFSLGNFQFGQRPFASLFPVLIKNPVVALSQGGGWDNFIEYGQSADVCSRKQKAFDADIQIKENVESTENKLNNNNIIDANSEKHIAPSKSRVSRAIKKRTVDNDAPTQKVDNKTDNKTGKKLYTTKPTSIRKSTRRPIAVDVNDDTKNSDPEGDLRFPFGSFPWFFNKKPDIPSPGFLINKLKVRKGGVAIAGPGGIATAGRGGTAIVGPGGLAYTKPGGLAIAGPHARVVALSPYTDLNTLVQRLPQPNEYFLQRSLPISEGKVVATGPVIYYHPTKETSSPTET